MGIISNTKDDTFEKSWGTSIRFARRVSVESGCDKQIRRHKNPIIPPCLDE